MDEELLRAARLGGSREERLWRTTADYLGALPSELEDAAYRACIVHWFDAEILDAIAGDGAGELYGQLQSFPFVEEYAGRGHNVHSLTRKTVLDHLWQERRDFYREVSTRAAAYFVHDLDQDGAAAVAELIEHAYHLLVADEPEALDFISWLLLNVVDLGHHDVAPALIEAAQEQLDAGRVSEQVRWSLLLWRARISAATGRNDEVLQLGAEVEAADDQAPRWVWEAMARLASQSLSLLGRFEEAYRWMDRARAREEPGSVDDAVTNLTELGRLLHAWNRHREAETAFLDALDRYVTTLLVPLRRVEVETADAPDRASTVLWMVATGDKAEEAILPRKVQARHPEAWTRNEDGDYLVAVSDPGDEDGASVTLPSVWPVDVDGVLADLWLRLAFLYEDMDDYQRADASGRLGNSIAADIGDEYLAAQTAQLLYRLGAAVGDAKVGQAVIRFQTKLLESARDRGDRNAQAIALANLGAAYADLPDVQKARECLTEALLVAREIPDLLGQVDALDRLAGLDWTQGRDRDAADRFEQAARLLRDGGLVHEQARLQVRIASFHLSRHRPDEARKYYREALARYRELQLPSGEFEALRGLGVVAENRLDYGLAVQHYNEAVAVARTLSSRSREADGLSLLASLQSLRGDHRAARRNYQQAIDLARSIGDRRREADLLLGLGDVASNEDLLEEALATYRRARKVYAELRRPDGELSALIGVLIIHTKRDHLGRAVRTAESVLELAERVGDRDDAVRAHREAAFAFSDAGQHERATELLEAAMRMDPEDPSLWGAMSWVLDVAGRYGEALQASERALAMDRTLAWVICNRALALLGLGRPGEALAAYRLAIDVRPEGQEFGNDIKVLKRFMDEHPGIPEGTEALRLLEQEQARLTPPKPPGRRSARGPVQPG